MGLNGIVADNVNPDAFSQCDIHDGPWAIVELAAVIANIQTLVGSYHDEIGCFGGYVRWSTPTTSCAKPEEMKDRSRTEKSDDNDYNQRNCQQRLGAFELGKTHK